MAIGIIQSYVRGTVGLMKTYGRHRNHHHLQVYAFCDYMEHISYGKICCIMCTLGLSVYLCDCR